MEISKINKFFLLLFYLILMIFTSLVNLSINPNLWIYSKYVHFLEFLVLGFLLTFYFYDKLNLLFFFIILFCLIFISLIDEGIQIFSPNRTLTFDDFIINIAGGFISLIIIFTHKKIKNG